jgi:hypothetical protein
MLNTISNNIKTIEVSNNGKLCVFFGTDTASTMNYVYFSNNFDTTKTFNRSSIEGQLPSATSSASYTYNGIYYLAVFYITDAENPTGITFFTVDEDGNPSVDYLKFQNTKSYYKYTAISYHESGTRFSVASYSVSNQSFKAYVTVVYDPNQLPLPKASSSTIKYLYTSSPITNDAIFSISCSYNFIQEGIFSSSYGHFYNYYMDSNNNIVLHLLYNGPSLYYKLSNLNKSEKFYTSRYINDAQTTGIRQYNVTFNNENTTTSQIQNFGTENTGETYTNLRMYDSSIYIFSSNKQITFSTNGTPTIFSVTGVSNWKWCALGHDATSKYTTMAICYGLSPIYYLNETICFLKNTKITILENDIEIEKQIELLKNGDLVKTNPNEYRKINFIGYQQINTLQNLDHLRVLPKNSISENLPYEDLYLTSGHSLLFQDLTHTNEFYNKDIYTNNIKNFYKIMTQHCSLCKNITSEEISNLIENDHVTVYHFSLESDDPTSQYAIYSNGVRSECMSYEFAINKSNMRKHIL